MGKGRGLAHFQKQCNCWEFRVSHHCRHPPGSHDLGCHKNRQRKTMETVLLCTASLSGVACRLVLCTMRLEGLGEADSSFWAAGRQGRVLMKHVETEHVVSFWGCSYQVLSQDRQAGSAAGGSCWLWLEPRFSPQLLGFLNVLRSEHQVFGYTNMCMYLTLMGNIVMIIW